MTTVANAAVLVTGAGCHVRDQFVTMAQRLSRTTAQPVLGMANRRDRARRVSALLDGTQRRGRVGMAPRGRVSPPRGQILYFNIPGNPIQGRIWYFDWHLLKYKI